MRLQPPEGQQSSVLEGVDGKAHFRLVDSFSQVEGVTQIAMLVWDTDTLSWVKFTGGGSGGGPASTVSVSNFPAVQAVTGTFYQATQPVSIADRVTTSSAEEKTIIDEASATVTYIGLAPLGTATASSAWKIKRLDVSGTETTVTFADGDTNYNKIWNNRASLTYL